MVDALKLRKPIDSFCSDQPGRSVSVVYEDAWINVGGDIERPAASVAKMPIVAAIEARRINLGDMEKIEISISNLPTSRYPSIVNIFDATRRLSLFELYGLALAASDNRVAQYLFELIGPAHIASFLDALGLKHTRIVAGFSDRELRGDNRRNVTTTNDMAVLWMWLSETDEGMKLLELLRDGVFKNRVGLRLPEDLEVYNKTGSLDGVSNDVALIRDGHMTMTISVLTVDQPDIGHTSIAIGDLTHELWASVGGRLDELE